MVMSGDIAIDATSTGNFGAFSLAATVRAEDPPDGDEKDEVLIPALESVVLDIDLARQKMLVDLPEGL